MTRHILTNIAVCKALGIDIKEVVGVDIKMRPDSLPRVQITRVLTDNHYAKTRQQFELRAIGPAEPAPLDLDAMCAKAIKRVRKTIKRCAEQQRKQISDSFFLLRLRLTPPKEALKIIRPVYTPGDYYSAAYDRLAMPKGGAA